jgi:hypothetical protein
MAQVMVGSQMEKLVQQFILFHQSFWFSCAHFSLLHQILANSVQKLRGYFFKPIKQENNWAEYFRSTNLVHFMTNFEHVFVVIKSKLNLTC